MYARISSDQSGEALGLTRQLEDCRKLAADHGWTVGDEFVDNDVSAFKGKPRPQYQRMLSDLAEGYRDGVIVCNMDRPTRQPKELEPGWAPARPRTRAFCARCVTCHVSATNLCCMDTSHKPSSEHGPDIPVVDAWGAPGLISPYWMIRASPFAVSRLRGSHGPGSP